MTHNTMQRSEINVPVACGMDWEAMQKEGPKAVKRFCGECKKHVHDLSSMSKDDARAVMSSDATEGLCVRFLYDEHGEVVFAGDTRLVQTNALSRMARARRFVTAAAALALPMSLNACMGAAARPMPTPMPAMSQTQIEPSPEQPSPDPITTPIATSGDAGAPKPIAKTPTK